jgi:hypothetical protein
MLENHETASVFVVDPTLTADEMHAGLLRAPVEPLFPAAITVGMFTARRWSMKGL